MKNNKLINYFQGVVSELKKVHWPTRQEVISHTVIVIISAVVATSILAALDYGLTSLVQYIVQQKG